MIRMILTIVTASGAVPAQRDVRRGVSPLPKSNTKTRNPTQNTKINYESDSNDNKNNTSDNNLISY